MTGETPETRLTRIDTTVQHISKTVDGIHRDMDKVEDEIGDLRARIIALETGGPSRAEVEANTVHDAENAARRKEEERLADNRRATWSTVITGLALVVAVLALGADLLRAPPLP